MFVYNIQDILGIGALGIGFLLAIGFYIYVCFQSWKEKRKK